VARAYLLTDQMVTETAARHAQLRPELDEVSRRAMGENATSATMASAPQSEGGVMGMTQKPSCGPRLLSLPTKAFLFPI